MWKNPGEEETHAYDDIIDLPHHVSERHPRMPMALRAAQFAPFAALSGYEDVVHETERLTDSQIELGEDARTELDRKLVFLEAVISEQPQITVRYFVPDQRKHGGSYRTQMGALLRIDRISGQFLFADGASVTISNILEIESEIFSSEVD